MPMLDAGWDLDDVADSDFLDRLTPDLNATAARRDDQDLTTRMRVPGSAGTWRKRHDTATGM